MAFPDDFSPESRDLDTNRYVYHYTSREVAFQHILSTRKIRLGPLSKTNDPRETTSWKFGIAGGKAIPDEDRKSEIERLRKIFQATSIIRTNCKVLCSSMDDPAYSPSLNEFHDFKRGFARSRMWAQYGEEHGGVCLIFDRAQLHQAVVKELSGRCSIYSEAVEYTDSTLGDQLLSEALLVEEISRHGLEPYLRRHQERFYRTFFFTKSMDWSREFEFRWIAIGEHDEAEFIPIGSAIAGIVVSVDFPNGCLEILKSFCKDLRIPGARISWDNGIPLLTSRLV